MPDDATSESISAKAAEKAREPRLIIIGIVLGLVVIAGLFTLFVLYLTQRNMTASQAAEIDAANQRITRVLASEAAAATASQQLADQVRSLGQQPIVTPATPTSGARGATGPTGLPGAVGAPGRGIAGTAIQGGHLVITFSDGTTTDVGQVAASTGTAGVSVTGATISNGDLVITYSSGTTADIGHVVGPVGPTGVAGPVGAPGPSGQNGSAGKDGVDGKPGSAGRSVSSVSNDDGHLEISYSDGTSQDAGALPVATAGRPPSGFSYTDALGGSHSCTPDTPADPGSSPHYTCS